MRDFGTLLSRPIGRFVRRAAALAVAALASVGALTELRDTDTFHLLAAGREIVRQRGFPRVEPFLFPLEGVPIGLMPSWLSSVLIYLSQLAAGDTGPVWLAALLSGATFLVLFLESLDREDGPAALVSTLAALGLAFAVFRDRAQARPENFAYLCLALTLLSLRRLDAGRIRPILFFPALALVWSNLHQSVGAGLAAVGLWLVVGAAHAGAQRLARGRIRGAPAPRQLGAAALAAAGGLAAALIIPCSGLGASLGFAVPALADSGSGAPAAAELMRRLIVELQPLARQDWLGPFGALVALTAASFAAGWRAASAREAATAAAFVALAAPTQRFAPMAALVLAPIAARNLAVGVRRLQGRFATALRTVAVVGGLAVLAAASHWALRDPETRFGTGLRADAFPVRAAEYLRTIGFKGRLYDTFGLGGYLEWVLDRPVFQDGRGFWRPGDAGPALGGPVVREQFAQLDSRYRFDALVVGFPGFSPMESAFLLEQLGPDEDWIAPRSTWSLVAFDDAALLYLRRVGPYAGLAARDEYPFALPANPFPKRRLGSAELAQGLIADLERSVSESPGCRRCRLLLGNALSFIGRPAEAERALEPALGRPNVEQFEVLLALAQAAERRGDDAAARGRYRQALDLGLGDRPWARRALARLELRAGDAAAALALVQENLREAPESAIDRSMVERIAESRNRTP